MSVSGSPNLSSGNPFVIVSPNQPLYWSVTTRTDFTTMAWFVSFDQGDALGFTRDISIYTWCVRGGQSHDAY